VSRSSSTLPLTMTQWHRRRQVRQDCWLQPIGMECSVGVCMWLEAAALQLCGAANKDGRAHQAPLAMQLRMQAIWQHPLPVGSLYKGASL
jgi:hypothetical protein